MANILILAPAAISAIAVSRGSGGANLLTASPKEAWVDSTVGTAVDIDIDFGAAIPVDTVCLGYVTPPDAGAVWTITGGAAAYTTITLKAAGALRAVDSAGQSPAMTHAFWTGAAATIRYLRLSVTQPAGQPVLSAGVVMAGAAFVPTLNKEWGAGRGVIDTGSATQLIDGGFGVNEGARKGSYSWTLGDLSIDEADALYTLLLGVGETRPVLVVEDPAATTGQRNRIHYSRFAGLKKYERRNPKQTRWDFQVEDWA